MSGTQPNKVEQSKSYQDLAKPDGTGFSLYEERLAEILSNGVIDRDVLPRTLEQFVQKERKKAKLDTASEEEVEKQVAKKIDALARVFIPQDTYQVSLNLRKDIQTASQELATAQTHEDRAAINDNINLLKWAYSVRLSPKAIDKALNADEKVWAEFQASRLRKINEKRQAAGLAPLTKLEENLNNSSPTPPAIEDPDRPRALSSGEIAKLSPAQRNERTTPFDQHTPDFDMGPRPTQPLPVRNGEEKSSLKTGDIVAGLAAVGSAGLLALSADAFLKTQTKSRMLVAADGSSMAAEGMPDPDAEARTQRKGFFRIWGVGLGAVAVGALVATRTEWGKNIVNLIHKTFRGPPSGFSSRY